VEWIHAIQSAIKFMEQHITEDISAEDVANHVHISSFHFQRGFRMLCGYSIMEYIRNRRLALAGGDLSATGLEIIGVAVKNGRNITGYGAEGQCHVKDLCTADTRNFIERRLSNELQNC